MKFWIQIGEEDEDDECTRTHVLRSDFINLSAPSWWYIIWWLKVLRFDIRSLVMSGEAFFSFEQNNWFFAVKIEFFYLKIKCVSLASEPDNTFDEKICALDYHRLTNPPVIYFSSSRALSFVRCKQVNERERERRSTLIHSFIRSQHPLEMSCSRGKPHTLN